MWSAVLRCRHDHRHVGVAAGARCWNDRALDAGVGMTSSARGSSFFMLTAPGEAKSCLRRQPGMGSTFGGSAAVIFLTLSARFTDYQPRQRLPVENI